MGAGLCQRKGLTENTNSSRSTDHEAVGFMELELRPATMRDRRVEDEMFEMNFKNIEMINM